MVFLKSIKRKVIIVFCPVFDREHKTGGVTSTTLMMLQAKHPVSALRDLTGQ